MEGQGLFKGIHPRQLPLQRKKKHSKAHDHRLFHPPLAHGTKAVRLNLMEAHEWHHQSIYNPRFRYYLQITHINTLWNTQDDVGQDGVIFSRFASFLVAHEIKARARDNHWLDYKAYSINQSDDDYGYFFGLQGHSYFSQNRIHTELEKEDTSREDYNCTYEIQKFVEEWSSLAVKEIKSSKAHTTRRSLIITFVTNMVEYEEKTHCGHCIIIAMEKSQDNKNLRLFIFDYRMHEYLYSIHDRLFHWMVTGCSRFFPNDSITCETVCLKDRLHVDGCFMTCMSVAYRVCTYLSFVKDPHEIHESESTFRASKDFLKHHIFSMINSLVENEDLIQKRSTAIVSSEMAKDIYEICSENCYINVVPFAAASATKEPVNTTQEIKLQSEKAADDQTIIMKKKAASVLYTVEEILAKEPSAYRLYYDIITDKFTRSA